MSFCHDSRFADFVGTYLVCDMISNVLITAELNLCDIQINF